MANGFNGSCALHDHMRGHPIITLHPCCISPRHPASIISGHQFCDYAVKRGNRRSQEFGIIRPATRRKTYSPTFLIPTLGRWSRRVLVGLCLPQSICPHHSGALATVTRVAYPHCHHIPQPCTRSTAIDNCHGQLLSLCPSLGFARGDSESWCPILLAFIRPASRASVAKRVQPFWPSLCSHSSSACSPWQSGSAVKKRSGPLLPLAPLRLSYLDVRSCRGYGIGRSKAGTTLVVRKVRADSLYLFYFV